jgi:hypothetical protein
MSGRPDIAAKKEEEMGQKRTFMETVLRPSPHERHPSLVLNGREHLLAVNDLGGVHGVIVVPAADDKLLVRFEGRVERDKDGTVDGFIDVLERIHVVSSAGEESR